MVRPANAEAGSISGAFTGPGLLDGGQMVMNQKLKHFLVSAGGRGDACHGHQYKR